MQIEVRLIQADLEVRLAHKIHVSPLKWKKKKGQNQKSEDALMLENGERSEITVWGIIYK